MPERHLIPGDYWIAPRIVKDYNIRIAVLERANYTIPRPEMTLSSTRINFGQLTFEVGRDSAKASVTISETGGYTPIEGLSLRRTKGEEGWIAHSLVDYIPPGKNATLNFTLLLPPDASLGRKSWEFLLSTKYAGSVNIAAEATVYFPGLEEAERHLAQLSSPPYQGAVQNLRQLIAASKDITELREIAMVMSVYSGAVSFISIFSDVNASSQEERIEAVILARDSLNRAKIGGENLKDRKLRRYAIPAVEALEEVWSREARGVVEALEARLEEKERDYRSTALDYRRLKILYSLMGDQERAKEYSLKQEEMERAYYSALREAASLLRSSEEEVAAARKLSLNVKEASFVVNPFHYEEVIFHYERAISLAEGAKLKLEEAGEDEQAELVAARVEELALGKRIIERAFAAYLALLTAFFLWFVARVTLGLIRWVRDSEALAEGDVVLGAEG